jgi:hypothetical protein
MMKDELRYIRYFLQLLGYAAAGMGIVMLSGAGR